MAKSRTAEIKKLIDENKAVIGTDRSISMLKLGEISRVYLSSNVPDKVKASLLRYAGGAEVVELDMSNYELGVVCKKPFKISVLSVVKK